MAEFVEVLAKDFDINPFKSIGQDWMLVTSQSPSGVNTMTASWGGLGVMWNKNVAFVVIRPQRYTKKFVDESNEFSLSFLPNEFKKVCSYLGTVSGRDEDKIGKSGLKLLSEDNIPFFQEANAVIMCKTLFRQSYDAESFLNKAIEKEVYPDKDYHNLYIAEITKILVKK